MSEQKSKMPDLKELASMTSKLFGDIKTSVSQIIQDYKNQRSESEDNAKEQTTTKEEEKDKK